MSFTIVKNLLVEWKAFVVCCRKNLAVHFAGSEWHTPQLGDGD